ncbi:MAG: TIGR00282 family metallophosphoesterase [Planctomycetota bacterium]
MPADGPYRVLLVGDVVGRPGREAVKEIVPELRQRWRLDAVIANAENSASGSGLTPRLCRELQRAGVDLMTLGDHTWKRRDNLDVLKKEPTVLRPHNYPDDALGTGVIVHEIEGVPIGFVTVLGRVFMGGVDCPFRTVDRALGSFSDDVKVRVVEVHAEATSEKIAMGWHVDGKVSCVFGTHTHVPTADDRILPHGTAYLSDLGMTGAYDGVIGRDSEPVLHKFISSMHASFTVAQKNVHLCGALLEVDLATGNATSVRRVDIAYGTDGMRHSPSTPLYSVEDFE